MPQWGDLSYRKRTSKPSGLAAKLAFTPFEYPTSPPAGTYDPALDASLRAAQRGYGDLQQDTEQGYERGTSDYATSVTEATQNRDRSLADTLRTRAREGADFTTNTGLLGRKYAQMGAAQGEQAGATGQIRGGALAGALAARTANQGIEQGALDTQHTRFGQDSSTQEQRINQDYNAPDTGIFAKLQTALQRQQDDAATGLGRAGRELSFYGQDVGEAKFGQAAQVGYQPPVKPSNEFSDAKGPYKLIIRGGVAYRQRPNGKLERR